MFGCDIKSSKSDVEIRITVPTCMPKRQDIIVTVHDAMAELIHRRVLAAVPVRGERRSPAQQPPSLLDLHFSDTDPNMPRGEQIDQNLKFMCRIYIDRQ
jgi:hypothetical protein